MTFVNLDSLQNHMASVHSKESKSIFDMIRLIDANACLDQVVKHLSHLVKPMNCLLFLVT